MFCPKCGRKIDSSARFCGYCGTPLGSSRKSTVPGPAPGYRRPVPAKKKKSGNGKILLTLILIVFLILLAVAAVLLILHKKPEKTSFLASGQGSASAENPPDTPAAEAASSDTAEPVPQTDTPVLNEAGYSMTVTGYSTFGSAGYRVSFTFDNRSSENLCLGYNRPAVNGTANNTEGSYSIPAGESWSGSINLNLAGICSPSEVQTISLPLFVYPDRGSANPMPSTQQASGNNYINTTVTLSP